MIRTSVMKELRLEILHLDQRHTIKTFNILRDIMMLSSWIPSVQTFDSAFLRKDFRKQRNLMWQTITPLNHWSKVEAKSYPMSKHFLDFDLYFERQSFVIYTSVCPTLTNLEGTRNSWLQLLPYLSSPWLNFCWQIQQK